MKEQALKAKVLDIFRGKGAQGKKEVSQSKVCKDSTMASIIQSPKSTKPKQQPQSYHFISKKPSNEDNVNVPKRYAFIFLHISLFIRRSPALSAVTDSAKKQLTNPAKLKLVHSRRQITTEVPLVDLLKVSTRSSKRMRRVNAQIKDDEKVDAQHSPVSMQEMSECGEEQVQVLDIKNNFKEEEQKSDLGIKEQLNQEKDSIELLQECLENPKNPEIYPVQEPIAAKVGQPPPVDSASKQEWLNFKADEFMAVRYFNDSHHVYS